MHDNRFVRARHVAIAIRRRARGVILDSNALDVHGERRIVEIGVAAGPLNGAFGLVGGAADPVADLDLHGCLGEVGTV